MKRRPSRRGEEREGWSLSVDEPAYWRICNTAMVFSMKALSNRGCFFDLQWIVRWESCHGQNSRTLRYPKVSTCVLDSSNVLVLEKKKSANSIELIGKTTKTKFSHFRCQTAVDEDQRNGLAHFFSHFTERWMCTSCSPYENTYWVKFSRKSDGNSRRYEQNCSDDGFSDGGFRCKNQFLVILVEILYLSQIRSKRAKNLDLWLKMLALQHGISFNEIRETSLSKL